MKLFFLCLRIFCFRILDVSLGTVCTLITVKGKKLASSLIGFIDILIWFFMAREALNTDAPAIFVAVSYAGGFAVGTYIGTLLTETFISGKVTIFLVTKKRTNLEDILRSDGYAVSVLLAKGMEEVKKLLFIEMDKKRLKYFKEKIKKEDPNAFFVIHESKAVYNGFFFR